MPSFLPMTTFVVEDLAKFAPTFIPKLVLENTPAVLDTVFETALPNDWAIERPVDLERAFETASDLPLETESVRVFVMVSDVPFVMLRDRSR